MPDAAGLGLAWKIATDLTPGDGSSPWSGGQGFGGPGAAGGGDPGGGDGGDDHEFEPGFWGGGKCRACGEPAESHGDGAPVQ